MRLRLALTALTTALSAGGVSAFAPATSAGRHLAAAASMRSSAAVAVPAAAAALRRSYAASATSLQMANVLKLSNPMEEMLNDVDVFIFDCDGVIWRVSLNQLIDVSSSMSSVE
jgi:4-nitrophenyl phosphatase/phosphoglycolate phosphatase